MIPVPGHRLRTVVDALASAESVLERTHSEPAETPRSGRPGPPGTDRGLRGAGAGHRRRPARSCAAAGPGGTGRRGRAVAGPPGKGRPALAWSATRPFTPRFAFGDGSRSRCRFDGSAPPAPCTTAPRRGACGCARTANPPGRSGWPDRLAAAGIVPAPTRRSPSGRRWGSRRSSPPKTGSPPSRSRWVTAMVWASL